MVSHQGVIWEWCLPLHSLVPGSGQVGGLGVGASPSCFSSLCPSSRVGGGCKAVVQIDVFAHSPSLGRQMWPWLGVGRLGWGLFWH